MRFFFPRVVAADAAAVRGSGRYDGSYEVPPASPSLGGAVNIGYRVFVCPPRPARGRPARGALLYFHGNGEVASDYDGISQLFLLMGLHMVVVDFRGYGWSTNTPTRVSTLLSDAEPLVTAGALGEALAAAGIDGRGLPLVAYGRSMGSHVATHAVAMAPELFSGLVFESGIASMQSLLGTRRDETGAGGGADAAATKAAGAVEMDGADDSSASALRMSSVERIGLLENEDKLRGLPESMPVLFIHGGADRIVSPEQASMAHRACGSRRARLELVEGAGHNDLGMAERYVSSIAEFIEDDVFGSGGGAPAAV